MRITFKQVNGFTMIELLIVIGIFLIISAFSIPLYNNWQPRTMLSSIQAELLQSLREVQSKARAGKAQSRHGLFIENENKFYTLYQGDNYSARDQAYDQEINFSDNILITASWGGAEINFATSTGAPGATGTISIINSANNELKTIVINRYGIIQK